MRKEQFHQCLEGLACYIEDATDMMVVKHPEQVKKRRVENNKSEEYERTRPAKGHTVVLSHTPQTSTCDWCQSPCSGRKTYSRSIGSQIWNGKCSDCGEKRRFYAGQERPE
jgi:RNase P subunit RPR2